MSGLPGLYDLGEQQPSGASTGSGQGWAYHLPDALGSVRQLTNASGGVTLAKSYEPYGTVLSSVGSGSSVYAFTGEQYDSQTSLVYLRARYYAPGVGRFVTRDTWTGDVGRPLSLNAWNYVEADPINRFDPAGLCADCFVVFFDGLGAINNEDPEGPGLLLKAIRDRTGANVIPVYPYHPGNQAWFVTQMQSHGEYFTRNPDAAKSLAASYGSGGYIFGKGFKVAGTSYEDQGATKALEVLDHVPFYCDLDEDRLPDYQYQARSVDFIGYSGGSQIAYSTATELIGKVFVDNLVTIGQVARFGRGLTNIGRIWDIRTPNDWDTRAYSGFLGWDAANRGWEPGPKFRMERNHDKDVYRHGAASCSILGDAKHREYFSEELLARGLTCAAGNRGFKSTWSAEADVKYLDALADFLIDYVGVGRP